MGDSITTISVPQRVKARLEELAKKYSIKGEWADILETLAATYERQQLAEAEERVIDIPHQQALEEELITAIEEAQPPPEWRLLLIYIVIGILGGAGLGAFLALR